MHLVFISTLFDPPWGGSEKLWSESAQRALKEGHKVSVFVSERSQLEKPLQDLADLGARFHFWRVRYRPLNVSQRILKKVLGRKLPEWEWWHRNLPQDADVICLNQGGIFCALMRHGLAESIHASGIPYFVLSRCDAGVGFLTYETRPFARKFLEDARAFIAASQSTVNLVRMYLPSRLPNAQVLHSPLADFGGTVDDHLRADRLEIACVGRLRVADKGQHLLLACVAEEAWRERSFRLTFYGEGPDRDYLEDLVRFYGLDKKVHFAGHTADVAGIWKNSHLAVQPSLVEGSPQSLLESMLCGRIAVATAVSGVPEWVEDGKTGFLAEAPTVRHLRKALERAWQNQHRWKEMGEGARAACTAKRDPDPAGTLLALLREAARQR